MPIDVKSRRRLLLDLATAPDVFLASGRSAGVETGAEPAFGEADEGNGGNAFPAVSGVPLEGDAVIDVKTRRGGALSAPRADGGAQQRWKYESEGSSMWRGASWEATNRAGYTAETAALRFYDGDAGRGKYAYCDAVVTPEGRVIICAQRTTGTSPFYGFTVDIFWRDSEDVAWNAVPDVVSDTGASVARCPRILRRPDGILLLYYVVVKDSGLATTFSASFSADEGESWGVLMEEAAPDINFNLTVDRLSVVYANGYVVSLMNQPGSLAWFYSVDGGVSFRTITYYGASPQESFASISVLIDETLLLSYATTDYPATVDSVRVCRVAAGLDLPDTLLDYTEVDTFTLASVLDVVQFRGYDGLPYLAICVDGTPAVWQVYRGTMDGTVWEAVSTSVGLFTPWTGGVQVQTSPGSLQVIPYQGTFAVVWVNDGVSTSPSSASYEGSVNWSPGAGAENVSVTWKWQWCWSMSGGDPNGAADGVTRATGGVGSTLAMLDGPRRISVTGSGAGRVSWTSSAGTRTNAQRTAVATGVYLVSAGCGKYTGKCVLDVTGSDGAASARCIVRLGYGNWGLADQTGLTIAEGDFDFHSAPVEVLLGVTKDNTGIKYALRVRKWNGGRGDRAWTVLAVGVHAIAAGPAAIGAVTYGSTQDLPTSADAYELMMGSFTLDEAVTDWYGEKGDGLFETGSSAVVMGHTMGTLPVPLLEGLFVSFSGDVSSSGDGFTVRTRWQYALTNLAPGERGEWRTEADLVEHYFTLDYAQAALSTAVGPWTDIAWWGTNFRTATVRMSNDVTFATYDEYDLDAAVLIGTASGAAAFGIFSTTRNVWVEDAGWETNRWVGYYFRWETGPLAGTAGTVLSNTEDTLVIGSGTAWTDADAAASDFVVYADRMFYSAEAAVKPKRYRRWIVPAQGTPDGFYRGKGIMNGPSHAFHANWEWESEERHSPLVETVESPGGQRYVYDLSASGRPRRERDVEWTGVKDGERQGLLGAWRAAGGGARVVALIEDTKGGPDALLPGRVVGEFKNKAQALYVQTQDADAPVLQVVDVQSLTVSEELK